MYNKHLTTNVTHLCQIALDLNYNFRSIAIDCDCGPVVIQSVYVVQSDSKRAVVLNRGAASPLSALVSSRTALSNQKVPCRHIRHFCGDKAFAVATI